ncbi:GSCOCG00007798001-RA-CDS [Cotesia congregata]|uniref:Uncharacterized protein n=1 Tax=Cotesia congregata TaxID=51543 RepID=A0A8J2MGH4_COTCN|nr:GSCOCG00007798001-RA-CDS [Cotesia congregata]CAG5090175.1 Protein of unknown function [Cotesia congregata]
MVFVINMRVFKTIFTLLIAVTSLVQAGPASFLRLEHRTDDDSLSLPMDNLEFSSTNSSSTTSPTQDTYDQRQNGTENYQIHVDGFVIVVAPVEALLLADAVSGGGNNDFFAGLTGAAIKPPQSKPEESKPTQKPVEEKPDTLIKKSVPRPHVRLVSFLTPFLRKIAQH